MKTIKINPKKYTKKEVDLIVDALNRGEVLVLPTDTVYGLVARSDQKKAVRNIFRIKNRPLDKPLPVFISNIEMAKKIAVVSSDDEKTLKKSWPGKVTFVMKRNDAYKKNIYGLVDNTIALRIPKYKLLNDILEKIGAPLSQTSANISGNPASDNIDQIISDFEKEKIKPDLIIDSGEIEKSRSSRIIDLTSGKVLRN